MQVHADFRGGGGGERSKKEREIGMCPRLDSWESSGLFLKSFTTTSSPAPPPPLRGSLQPSRRRAGVRDWSGNLSVASSRGRGAGAAAGGW